MKGPNIILIMGTMSSGKTYIGKKLARQLGWQYHEGDSDHSSAMKAKMYACLPLTDEDRQSWLDIIRDRIARWDRAGERVVVTCSALKRAYRNHIRVTPLQLIHLYTSKEVLIRRANERTHEYMCPALVDSQLSTLEPPTPDENPISVNSDAPADQVIQTILEQLRAVGVSAPSLQFPQ